MSDPADSVRKKSGEFLRELAAHQGVAYRSYSEALARYGEGSSNISDLMKEAGDLYYREAGRVASGLFAAFTEAFSSSLDRAKSEIAEDSKPVEPKTAAGDKPSTK
jgi:hypothetical protein